MMSRTSTAKRKVAKPAPNPTINLIELLISQAAAKRRTQRRGKGASRTERPDSEPPARIDDRIRGQLQDLIASGDRQTSMGSPARLVRQLLRSVESHPARPVAARDAAPRPQATVGLPPLYELDEIPSLSVWHGSSCSFVVEWQGRPDAAFELRAEPCPKGALFLERPSSSDGTWLFSYTPDPEDKFAFTVTITAVSGDQSRSHAFELAPMPILPAEQSAFGLDPHAVPEIVDYGKPVIGEEVVEHTHFQDSGFVFNYKRPTTAAGVKLRRVAVIGESVVFDEAGDPYGLYATCNGALDVEKLEIWAEKVIVRSPLRLPQTQVVIHARQLHFEGGTAQIKTTPWEKTETPDISQPGEDGLKAGDVTLNISEFHADPAPVSLKRLDLTGGRGQPGGPGKAGGNGADISQYWKDFQWTDSGIHFKKTAPDDYWVVYQIAYCQSFLGIPIKAFSNGTEKGWPGDGKPALPSGKPGEGGAGGVLSAACDVSGYFSVAGGAAGAAPKPRGAYYAGGRAGWPQKSIKYKAHYFLKARFDEIGRHESRAGGNAEVKFPQKPCGDLGHYRNQGSRYTWLHPVLMTRLLNHAKDDFLGNRIADAELRLADGIRLLQECRSQPLWEALQQTDRLELGQVHNEMQLLLHRIKNNLDYFGNPAGWVPLLSFEVNQTLFDNEIDRAADMLYYAYCIRNKASSAEKTFNALKSARAQLEKDIGAAIAQYNDTVARLSDLKTQAENLEKKTLDIQFKLQAKEEELKNKAAPPAWITMTRLGLKIGGTIVSMIPVYQPATGMIGSGMMLLSDFDPDRPWDTIIGGADITTAFLKSSYDEAASDLKEKMTDQKKLKEADPQGSLSQKMKYLDSARQSATALSAGLKDIQSFMEKQSAPQPKIEAELEKLKSQSEEYQGLVAEIENLLEQKRAFAEHLASVMQLASSLSNYIHRSILAIDAMNLDMRQVQAGLDKRTSAYVEDMQRRAYDRLLEYHYYVAKAYEYRILEAYTQPLDFKELIKRLEELAQVDAWDKLAAEAFKQTYAVVYREKLAEIANKIFGEYNRRTKEHSLRFDYLLSEDELQRLNSGRTIKVDFARYLPNEENLRIIDVGVLMRGKDDPKGEIKTAPEHDTYPPNAYIDLTFAHPGISRIKSAGNVYQFLHYHLNGANPLVWRARYTPGSDIVTHSFPSAAGESLLRSLLKGDALSDMMLYCRPSVWADLEISKSGYPNGGRDVLVTHLRLELNYDYFAGIDSVVSKHVLVTVVPTDPEVSGTARESDFKPYFIVDRADKNKRGDARGTFLRSFPLEWGGHVTITAQPKYGDWVFNKWTDVTGHELPQAEGNRLALSLRDDELVCAQYVSARSQGTRAAGVVAALHDARLLAAAARKPSHSRS